MIAYKLLFISLFFKYYTIKKQIIIFITYLFTFSTHLFIFINSFSIKNLFLYISFNIIF